MAPTYILTLPKFTDIILFFTNTVTLARAQDQYFSILPKGRAYVYSSVSSGVAYHSYHIDEFKQMKDVWSV